MPTLSPAQAAAIARGVYLLRDQSVSALRNDGRGSRLGCEGLFKVEEDSSFKGKSGALWKRISNFGYIAEGEGAYQGEVLLVTRGTAILPDWVTDANCGMQIGPGGHLVHAGFNDTWKSFTAEVQAFLRGRNPSTIHCVGHSLGGALATLNADHLSSVGAGQVKLYTFGCPRTGTIPFARALTTRVGAQNMFRVHHLSDPVTMVPIFPFQHVPTHLPGLSITNSDNGLINFNAHRMLASYEPAVSGLSWEDLVKAQPQAPSDIKTQSWLESMAANQGTVLKGSAKALTMIGHAMTWLLKKAGQLMVGVLGTAIAVGCTVLDQVAWMLTKAVELSAQLGRMVMGLIVAIMRFLGRTASTAGQITTAFLRWVMELLFGTLRQVAIRALGLVG
jgi:triacylglycerol lipase